MQREGEREDRRCQDDSTMRTHGSGGQRPSEDRHAIHRPQLEAGGRRCDSPVVITTVAYHVIYDAGQLRFPAWPVASVGLAVALAGVGLGAYLRRRGITSAATRTVV